MTMRRSILVLLPVVAGLALVPRAAPAQGEFHWKGKIAAGKAIEIKGVNGDVRAVAGSGDVEVTAVKHARRSDPDETVDFTVRVPTGVRFLGKTVNGEVEAAVLSSDLEAKTVNGSIRISTAGYAEAQTVNGEIVASLGRATWSEAIEFRTVNGGITLDLPAGLSTEVRATTVNGDIQTDFPLMVTGRLGPRSLRGTIGSGGRRLALETVHGLIRLRKCC